MNERLKLKNHRGNALYTLLCGVIIIMDLGNIEKDKTKRQNLIRQQKGDGIYNPKTGVYKWGESVYDLTKTNGEIGLGWMPMRSKILS